MGVELVRAPDAPRSPVLSALDLPSGVSALTQLTHHLSPHLRTHAVWTVTLALPDFIAELGLGTVQTGDDLVVEFPVLSDDTCIVSLHPSSPQLYALLNTERLKQVSAPRVSSFGAGAGKESAYADAVPNGSVEDGVDAPDMVMRIEQSQEAAEGPRMP